MTLLKPLGVKNTPHVTREALTLLNWAIHEVRAKRVILSDDPDCKNVHHVGMENWTVTSDKKWPPMAQPQ